MLEDDRRGRRKLLVGNRAHTRFLFVSVTFDTLLHVWEDDDARCIRFQNAREGFMKKFGGMWTVKPFNQKNVDWVQRHGEASGIARESETIGHSSGWSGAARALASLQQHLQLPGGSSGTSGTSGTSSLVTLEQAILPRVVPPGPIRGVLRTLCARTLQGLMNDLRAEAQRRKTKPPAGRRFWLLVSLSFERRGLGGGVLGEHSDTLKKP